MVTHVTCYHKQMTVHFRRLRTRTEDCTVEDPPPYRAGPAAALEPPPTTAERVAAAHAHHQGIPYETGEPWLQRRPERLRTLTDLIPGGTLNAGKVAYALAALVDRIENARVEARSAH